MTSKDQKGNTLLAFAVGALMGAGITVLLAPQSGKKTRRDLRRMGQKAMNKTEALRLELSRSIDNMADEVWDGLQNEIDRGRDWSEKKVSEFQRAIEAGKDFIRGEINKVKGS
jgi:gas vesicle protein